MMCAVLASLLVSPLAMHGGVLTSRSARSVARYSVMTAPAAKAEGFVQTEMRKAAMELHTKDQAPREGQQRAQKPVAKWTPTLAGYLQFLVDSREVYAVMERVVGEKEELAGLRNTGLERTKGLDADIAWMQSEHGLAPPEPTSAAADYAASLPAMSVPAFICHFYNYYFAHTAGGRMIGKQMSDMLLDGATLEFYKWDGDVKEMLDATRAEIDRMAAAWSDAERSECLAETAATFKGSGGLLASLKG